MRNIELGEQMLVSAVRYALGRQTYIVKQTVDEVLRVWDQLSPGVQALISRDVWGADSWGMRCDEEQWTRVLECGGVYSYRKGHEPERIHAATRAMCRELYGDNFDLHDEGSQDPRFRAALERAAEAAVKAWKGSE